MQVQYIQLTDNRPKLKRKQLRFFNSIWLPVILLSILGSCWWHSETEKPKAVLDKGDYWVTHFNTGDFQNSVIYGNLLYCNTCNSAKEKDYFYCFDLGSGKVRWRHPIENFASQPPMITNRSIFFSTYLGDLHYLDLDGNCLWQRKFGLPYGGHFIDVSSGNPVVYSVMEGVWEYNKRNGQVTDRSKKLPEVKAYLKDASKHITPIRPYTIKVPSKEGMYELDIRQQSVLHNGTYEYMIVRRKVK